MDYTPAIRRAGLAVSDADRVAEHGDFVKNICGFGDSLMKFLLPLFSATFCARVDSSCSNKVYRT
jgi:hypothetical protein